LESLPFVDPTRVDIPVERALRTSEASDANKALRLLDTLEVAADVGSLLAARSRNPRFKLGVAAFKATIRTLRRILVRRDMQHADDNNDGNPQQGALN